jgi:hypothetical protein
MLVRHVGLFSTDYMFFFIAEDWNIYNYRCENLESYLKYMLYVDDTLL